MKLMFRQQYLNAVGRDFGTTRPTRECSMFFVKYTL